MEKNIDNNNIQTGNNNTSTATTPNTIGNHTLQDQSMDPEVTITNRASEDHNNNTANNENTSSTTLNTKAQYVVVPCTKGLSESFKKYVVSMGYKHTSRETLQSSKH